MQRDPLPRFLEGGSTGLVYIWLFRECRRTVAWVDYSERVKSGDENLTQQNIFSDTITLVQLLINNESPHTEPHGSQR